MGNKKRTWATTTTNIPHKEIQATNKRRMFSVTSIKIGS
jgi:hypothetical protein